MNSTHSDSGYIYTDFAVETQEQPWAQGQTLQTGSIPCCWQQGSFGVNDLHLQRRWREHVSTGPTCQGLLGFLCLCSLHAQEPSMTVLQQTGAYISTPFQTLTLSTIPSSPCGEETLDQGNSSHRQAQGSLKGCLAAL